MSGCLGRPNRNRKPAGLGAGRAEGDTNVEPVTNSLASRRPQQSASAAPCAQGAGVRGLRPRSSGASAAAREAGGSKGGASSPRQSHCVHNGYAGPTAVAGGPVHRVEHCVGWLIFVRPEVVGSSYSGACVRMVLRL